MQENSSGSLSSKAVIFALLSFFFLSLIAVFVKIAGREAPLAWIVFVQYASSLLFTLIPTAKFGFATLKTKKIGLHFIRSATGLTAFALYAVAVSEIPMVDATLLQNTAPIFIPLIALIWLRSQVDSAVWWGIVVGFAGIVLIIEPFSSDFVLNSGDIYGLFAGLALAVAFVAVKQLSATEHFNTILFYMSLLGVTASMPFAVMSWESPPLLIWLAVICSGGSLVMYQLLLQLAYKYAEPVKLSPFNYSIVVFAGVFDWVLFNHVPDWMTIAGTALVTAGGILSVVIHGRKKENVQHNWH